MLEGKTAGSPTDGPSDKRAVSFLFDFTTNAPSADNCGSAGQVPQKTPIQPVQVFRHENLEASSTTNTSCAVGIHNTTLLSISSSIPQAPTNFGCDMIIEDLLSLVERSVSITLFGAGGTGKTTIALAFLHHVRITTRFGNRRYFVCCDDLVNSLESFIRRLSEAIGARNFTSVAQLRTHLSLSPPCILVLDRVDSILDPLVSGAAEISAAIEELGRCQNVRLLLTSRMGVEIPHFRRIKVPTLSADDARNIFHSVCHLGRSVAIEKLLAELDFHPLSIDLLASAVRENDWDEPAMLKAWNDGKTSILEASGRQSLEDNIRSILDTPTIRALEAAALETLEALAAFPGGVKESKLESMFAGIAGVGEAVDAFCKFSLVYRQDGFVKMLSPFRFYFLESKRTRAIRSGSDATHNPAAEHVQSTRYGVVNFGVSSILYPLCDYEMTFLEGPPADTLHNEQPKDRPPGFTDWNFAKRGPHSSSYYFVAS